MNVSNAAVHSISKQQHSNVAAIHFADDELVSGAELDALVLSIVQTYNQKCSKHVGSLQDQGVYPFHDALRDYTAGNSTFLDMTTTVAALLKQKMEETPASVGGDLLFVHYTQAGSEYLMLVKLHRSRGRIFDEQRTHVVSSQHLEVDSLQVAGRIDLTALGHGQQRHVTFVSKRDHGHPSGYFTSFLGCKLDAEPRAETRKLRSIVENYCTSQKENAGMTDDQILAVGQRVFDYMMQQRAANLPISLEAVSAAVSLEEPMQFLEHLNAQDDRPTDGFFVDRSEAKKFVEFKFRGDGLTLNMSYRFRSDHVTVDGSSVTIANAPPRLLEQLGEE